MGNIVEIDRLVVRAYLRHMLITDIEWQGCLSDHIALSMDPCVVIGENWL